MKGLKPTIVAVMLFQLLTGILAIPTSSVSQEFRINNFDGNELYEWLLLGKQLNTRNRPLAEHECFQVGIMLGFVAGVNDGLNGRDFCLPKGTTRVQTRDIVLQYLETHPEERHLNGVILVSSAIAVKFPCRK